MALPKFEFIQTNYHNPHASQDLKLNILVIANTSPEILQKNVIENSKKYDNWLRQKPAHDGKAVIIAGGYSSNFHIDDIKKLVSEGATVITMNGSAKWCRDNDIEPDWQVIVDAKEDTASLVDKNISQSFFASQCNPKTLENAVNLTLVHYGLDTIEQYLPEERVKQGGYTLLGCGLTVGESAMAVAFSQGFRDFHLFGYDSSYYNGQSHAFSQELNQFMPTVNVDWQGKTYQVSVAMKGQAEKFPINAMALKKADCKIEVYGDGLLQNIFRTPFDKMSEQEKYRIIWNHPSYREIAPGEHFIDFFMEIARPKGSVIDFGCGTGKAGVKLEEKGLDVTLIDFVDNCRNEEALHIPFIVADISDKIESNADYGYCTDVMEHIPTQDVQKTIFNIMNAASKVFFNISTIEDEFGKLFGGPLHNTVKSHEWWKEQFKDYTVHFALNNKISSIFYVENTHGNTSSNTGRA